MRVLVSGLVLALGVLGTASLVQAAGNIEDGKRSAAVCAGCHGADGNSVTPAFPKLAGLGEKYLIKQIKDIKSKKRPIVEMTGLTDNLSDQDIENIAAFYNSQKSTTGQADPEQVELGRTLYKAGNSAKGIPACTGCHAPNGAGNEPAGFPQLAGQHAVYTEAQLKKFQAGTRGTSDDTVARMMQDIAANLSEKEIKALASYISGLY